MNGTPPGTGDGRRVPHSRVLVVDVSPSMRAQLQAELRGFTEGELVGVAGTSAEALALFLNRRPDIVIMSVSLPEMGGFETLRCMKRAIPGCTVILTTPHMDEFVQQAACFLGAAAVCLLNGEAAQIRRMLERFIPRKSNPA